jgi:acyl dehydratase
MDSSLMEQLRGMVGTANAPEIARDPVCPALIRHWCDAMTDHNPVYTDPEFATRSIHGGIVAPPAMLNAWNMPGLPGRRGDDRSMSPMRALDAAGFTSVIATNSEHEYLRYLRVGERLHASNELVDVSEEKQTALGLGHFVTSRTTYRTQDGEEVGRMFFRLLKFRPGTGRPASSTGTGRSETGAPGGGKPARPPRRETTLPFAEVRDGDALALCPVPITTTLIVAGAIASRDYQDVHHDRDAAIRRGTPDIFMNILTSSGLVARYVSDWAGPEALLTALRIRLGAPNHPGDTLLLEGRVAKADGGRVELAIRGVNRLGDHVTGSALLRLP